MGNVIPVAFPKWADSAQVTSERGQSFYRYMNGGYRPHFGLPATQGPCVIGHSAIDLLGSDQSGVYIYARKIWYREPSIGSNRANAKACNETIGADLYNVGE